MNARTIDVAHIEGAYINAALLLLGFPDPTWLIRDAFEECTSWDCAVLKFQGAWTISPSYMIVAGVKENEAAVISRDRFSAANTKVLEGDEWYLLQTNSDHFKGVCLDRCAKGREQMDKLGPEGVTLEKIRETVLEVPPVKNELTTYNALMNPKTGYFDPRIPPPLE